MAEIKFTDEEKALASYLHMDDAALGRFTKYVAIGLEKINDDASGLHRVMASSISMMLVGIAVDANATDLCIDLKGHSHKDIPTGDWKIVVTRVRKPKKVKP